MGFLQSIRNAFWPPSQTGFSGYLVRDRYPGAWQANDEIIVRDPSAYHAVFSCVVRIAEDVGKLPLRLTKLDTNGIWREHASKSLSPILRRPNKFQNSHQFYQCWIGSLLTHGNTFAIKERGRDGKVIALYILDPTKVRPVTASDGSYAYEVDTSQINELAGIFDDTVLVPPEEMIHDRYAPIFGHPLLGVSPISAALAQIGVATEIQKSQAALARNQGRLSGALVAPGALADQTVEQLRAYWADNYSGANNTGKIAVLADGLQYKEFQVVTGADAEALDTLKWSADIICSVFSVPPHMVHLGTDALKYDNIAALNQQYYNLTLMPRLESIEALLNEGLGLEPDESVEFDVTNLLRMDGAALIQAQGEAVGAGLLTPNEGRRNLNLGPLDGGDTVYLQQQMWPIEKLANRRDLPSGDNDNTEVNKYFRILSKIKRIEKNAA